jgi:hypothetical protein
MHKPLDRRTVEWRRIAQYEPVRVDGVAVKNDDGSDRQEILRGCREGIRLVLRRERKNSVDPQAVALFTPDGWQIGYLSPDVAAWVAPLLDADRAAFDAEIWSFDQIAADGGRTLIGCTIGLTEFRFVLVERFSWALAIAAAARLPAETIKWTVKWTAGHVAPLLRSSIQRD